ncbi:uncharacterized protein LOC130745129 [Lotus japonicus]|uniref:uncharacterized protein LOC130745129 n=1 Tax=Lotus japonicus TaxID=34305 RepID=UPI00258A0E2E|nr:uncharacterized protein LOC130745129 [Lotus japonicus]
MASVRTAAAPSQAPLLRNRVATTSSASRRRILSQQPRGGFPWLRRAPLCPDFHHALAPSPLPSLHRAEPLLLPQSHSLLLLSDFKNKITKGNKQQSQSPQPFPSPLAAPPHPPTPGTLRAAAGCGSAGQTSSDCDGEYMDGFLRTQRGHMYFY